MKAELNLTGQSLQVKALGPLFQMNLADTPAPLFDVTADGQRFLAVTPARAESSSISLLLNWSALLHKQIKRVRILPAASKARRQIRDSASRASNKRVCLVSLDSAGGLR